MPQSQVDHHLVNLAHSLEYELSQGELNLYRTEISKYPIWAISKACALAADDFIKKSHYPSISWFKTILSGTLKS